MLEKQKGLKIKKEKKGVLLLGVKIAQFRQNHRYIFNFSNRKLILIKLLNVFVVHYLINVVYFV